MFRSGIIIFGIRPAVDPGGFIATLEIGIAVIKPEGNIHSGNFFQPLLRSEILGEQRFSFTELQKCCGSIFPVSLEGKYRNRLNTACQTCRQKGWVVTVRAEGGSSSLFRQTLAAAGRTLKCILRNAFCFCPFLGRLGFPDKFLLILPGLTVMECLIGIQVERIGTVFSGEFLNLTAKCKTCIAAGTFVLNDIGFFVHKWPPSFPAEDTFAINTDKFIFSTV